jgi:hypothetical protein
LRPKPAKHGDNGKGGAALQTEAALYAPRCGDAAHRKKEPPGEGLVFHGAPTNLVMEYSICLS